MDSRMNPYSGKKLSLPEPGSYVIYSGTRKEHPEWISLADEFLGVDRFSLELRVKVLYESNKGDILGQYLKFSSIYNNQMKKKKKAEKAIDVIRETIRICRDENVLKEYLEFREKEVINILLSLFDDEYRNEVRGREMREQGHEEGRKEGREKGREENTEGITARMLKLGLSKDQIAQCTNLTLKKANRIEEKMKSEKQAVNS